MLFALQSLELPLVPRSEDPERGLAFDFLESLPDEARVLTGHASGIITLNVAEADDDYRERNRESLKEPYRTIIGHLRHELGHYYWDVLVDGGAWLTRFRELFGDERADYAAALQKHYADGPPADWATRHISPTRRRTHGRTGPRPGRTTCTRAPHWKPSRASASAPTRRR